MKIFPILELTISCKRMFFDIAGDGGNHSFRLQYYWNNPIVFLLAEIKEKTHDASY